MAKLMLFGDKKVIAKLQSKSLTGNAYFTLKVGFDTEYAVRIHEDLSLNHPNGGQAKYLEQPAREFRREMMEIVRTYLARKKRSLEDATLAAGRFLLEKAKELVPVLSGRLRDSGFVRLE